MSAKRFLLAVIVLLCGSFAAVQASDRSFDITARLLSTPLADPVAAPEMNKFRFGLIGGRWHFRDNNYSIDITTVGLTLGYTRYFDEHLGINLHLNANSSTGHNSPFEVSGLGGEFGVDFIYGLNTKPNAHGSVNGSSVFAGLLAWEGRWDGVLHDQVFGPTGRQDLEVDLLTYLFRAGWQGRFYVAPRASMEPAVYLYLQNHARRVQIGAVGLDDDANPTSVGVAANFNAAFHNLLNPGDSLTVGLAGALTFDHNVGWQLQGAYTFGALNEDPDAN